MKFIIMFFILSLFAACSSEPVHHCKNYYYYYGQDGSKTEVCDMTTYQAPPLHKQ